MAFREPVNITDPSNFFLQPALPKQRQYEALRTYFVEGRPSQEVARAYGYSPGAFRVLCHSFCHDPQPAFFLTTAQAPALSPKSPPPDLSSSPSANKTIRSMKSVKPSKPKNSL